jgi:sugar O-acyltransferase (sialic acid O-acetyltransferase NeuD family)
MSQRLLIIGAGGHGKVVADLVTALRHTAVGFVDGDPARVGQIVGGIPIVGAMNRLEHLAREFDADAAVVAIGDNRVRLEHLRELRRTGLRGVTLVHPHATVAHSATLGEGTVICAGARICADATIGDGGIVNTNAVVDHECVLEPACHVCPAAALAGRVSLGQGAFVGIGASVIQCLSIGAWSTVGAGATVTRDVEPGSTVVGTPARSVR